MGRVKKRIIKQKFSSKKELITIATYKLETALNKLRHTHDGLKRKEASLFNLCVEAQMNKDQSRAIIYANECSEIRKLTKLVTNSELTLEQAILRMHTVLLKTSL